MSVNELKVEKVLSSPRLTGTFDDLVDARLLLAGIDLGVALNGQGTAALGLSTLVCAGIHSALKRISFPSEEIVTVLSVAGSSRAIELVSLFVGEKVEGFHDVRVTHRVD